MQKLSYSKSYRLVMYPPAKHLLMLLLPLPATYYTIIPKILEKVASDVNSWGNQRKMTCRGLALSWVCQELIGKVFRSSTVAEVVGNEEVQGLNPSSDTFKNMADSTDRSGGEEKGKLSSHNLPSYLDALPKDLNGNNTVINSTRHKECYQRKQCGYICESHTPHRLNRGYVNGGGGNPEI